MSCSSHTVLMGCDVPAGLSSRSPSGRWPQAAVSALPSLCPGDRRRQKSVGWTPALSVKQSGDVDERVSEAVRAPTRDRLQQ